MSGMLADRYRRWFEYEKDCNAKVLSSLSSVPPDRQSTPEFQRAVTLLGHVMAARRLWLFRFGVLPEGPREFFPAGLTPDDLADHVAEVEAAWDSFLSRLDDAGLARMFEYQSLDAGRFRSSIDDILTQLFGHSWYHRGQIATLVRTAGGQSAVTDYVFWSREPIP
jgi:uncharacterized damage-inducible protein DinB